MSSVCTGSGADYKVNIRLSATHVIHPQYKQGTKLCLIITGYNPIGGLDSGNNYTGARSTGAILGYLFAPKVMYLI